MLVLTFYTYMFCGIFHFYVSCIALLKLNHLSVCYIITYGGKMNKQSTFIFFQGLAVHVQARRPTQQSGSSSLNSYRGVTGPSDLCMLSCVYLR